MVFWICIVLLALGGIAAFVVGDSGSLGGLSGDTLAGLCASLALLIYLGSSLLGDYKDRIAGAVRDFGIWAAVALALIVGYSFKDEAGDIYNRVRGELLPPGQAVNVSSARDGYHAVRIRRGGGSHFTVGAKIAGTEVQLLIDTGASTVVLKQADARAVGIDTSRLSYSVPVNTANGATFAASVKLREISIGPIVVRDIEALVSKPGALKQSLLGMNFLRRLRSYEFSGEFLTLRGL
ncbi:MAG: TIGR02281 family clan AA aspartic protease [Hyphomicrobiaceae bacterium]|nr:TIGR02281 family clan AA aspartic protease [Hyphomicrobiaceae bacterium]